MYFFKKSVDTVVSDNGKPLGALLWTALDENKPKTCTRLGGKMSLVTCRTRVICKKIASQSGTIGAQSEN